MGRSGDNSVRARERERLRRIRAAERVTSDEEVPTTRRGAARRCGWCGSPIDLKETGRIPKWCSSSCRQRAWEQRRAAASGRAAVEIVERVLQVPVYRLRTPRHGEWSALLDELSAQLDSGRIYQRDLEQLRESLASVLAAVHRRR